MVLSQQVNLLHKTPCRVAPNCLLPESSRLGYTPVRIPVAMQLILWDKAFAIPLSRSSTCVYNCRCLQVISTLSNAHWAVTHHPVWQHQGQCWATPLYSGCELSAISVSSLMFLERTWTTRRLSQALLSFLDAKNLTGHLGATSASTQALGSPRTHRSLGTCRGTPWLPDFEPPTKQTTHLVIGTLSEQSLLLLST